MRRSAGVWRRDDLGIGARLKNAAGGILWGRGHGSCRWPPVGLR